MAMFADSHRKDLNGRDALGQEMGNISDVNFMLSSPHFHRLDVSLAAIKEQFSRYLQYSRTMNLTAFEEQQKDYL